MQQALDALKAHEVLLPMHYKNKWIGIQAIAALEAELAKPEQPQTDLRKAAEMALEALEDIAEFSPLRLERQIDALRQALAQPEQETNAQLIDLLEALKSIDMTGIRYNETPVEAVARIRAIACDAIAKVTGDKT